MIKTSLFASQERESKLNEMGDVLSVMNRHIDFTALAAEIDRAVPRPSKLRGGRPPFPTELMVRVLLVQQLFNLSDEQTEYQLLDRLSFQRFVGLRESSQTPDRTTIWTFKERLIAAQASDRIFEAANAQLARYGYVARGGQMVDASLVTVPIQHIGREDKALVNQGATPLDWSPAQRRQKDTEAAWVKKHGRSHFGYKLTTSTDVRYKLIRKIAVSTSSTHDTLHLEAVLDEGNTSRDLYADKGYTDKEREVRLRQQGWRPHIQRKAKKGRPLSVCQEKRNHRISKTRVRVEHPYAALVQMGGKVLRSIGLARARLHLSCKVATYNLRRLCYLIEAGIVPLRSRIAS